MNVLFTKSNSILSKAIRWITKESMSHTAIELDGLVFHSNLLGVHVEGSKRFRASCTVIEELEVPESLPIHLVPTFEEYDGDWYDFGAFLFLGMFLFLNTRFKVKLPKNNDLQSKNAFICTEFVSRVLCNETDSMITPYGLYLELKNRWKE